MAACTEAKIAAVMRDVATIANPKADRECLHEGHSECWGLCHWHAAKRYCKPALEATPSTDPLSVDIASGVSLLTETPEGNLIPDLGVSAFHHGK